MDEKNDVSILPSDNEKLSHKFIFDSVRKQSLEAQALETESVEYEAQQLEFDGPPDDEEDHGETVDPQEEVADENAADEDFDGEEDSEDPVREVEADGSDEEIDLAPAGDAAMGDTYDPLLLHDDKNYFRIREASEIIGVEPHVLRYWESEFPAIRPMKNASGKRAYSRKDLELFHKIKFLLYQEKFSLKGAKKKLKHWNEEVESKTILQSGPSVETLKTISHELKDLIHLLRQDPGGF